MSKTSPIKLSPSQEDYLETILELIRQKNAARVRDIARKLQVGMPAVTSALKLLGKRKLVNYDPYQWITLTDRGRKLAEAVIRRHETISRFLRQVLGLNTTTAERNACRIEHAVDDVLLRKMACFVDFIEEPPAAMLHDWRQAFAAFCTQRKTNH